MWHIFSVCCKQTHVCATYLVTLPWGEIQIAGRAHGSEAFSSSSMMIMFLLRYCFSSLFSSLCVFALYVFCVSLWCGFSSLGFG